MEVLAEELRFLDIVVRDGQRYVILDDPKLVESKGCYVAPTYNQDTTQFNSADEFVQGIKIKIVRTISPRPSQKSDAGMTK